MPMVWIVTYEIDCNIQLKFSSLTLSFQISHLIALAPIFHVGHIEGALYRLLMPFRKIIGKIYEDITNGSFLPANNVSRLCSATR